MARQGLCSLDDAANANANATARLIAYVEEASARDMTRAALPAPEAPPLRPRSADQTDEFDTLALIESL